ncbi:HNH endonuclease [Ruegeria hyattellae]|uniref:HNH endonuclease n=1 Tax=Ruegeria hyattellae TaxID=3233337 RepID=UPI00355B4523
MRIEWEHPACITCLGSKELSLEHVIPDSLGGILTSRFLCRECNSLFGSTFEAAARLAPELRKAASGLGPDLTQLKEKLERGAEYQSQFGDLTSRAKVRKDGNTGVLSLKDGSIVVPEEDTLTQIRSRIQKRGGTASQVEEAISRWRDAPVGQDVELVEGLHVKKWEDHPSSPTYSEPPLSPLVPLKTAYEFAALLIGGKIYDQAFDPLRTVLLDQDEELAEEMVEYMRADKPDAFHGIAFDGNIGGARFQIRLFGLLAYRVSFPSIGIKLPPVVYTHRLDTGEDWFLSPDEPS